MPPELGKDIKQGKVYVTDEKGKTHELGKLTELHVSIQPPPPKFYT